MKKRPVRIYRLELRSWDPPCAQIFVHCSSGTYIRSLARDIALAAGSRAHLTGLLRTRVAGFKVEDAWAGTGEWGPGDAVLRPVDRVVISALGMPLIEVSSAEAEKIIHGRPLLDILGDKSFPPGESSSNISAAVFSDDTLVAIVERIGGKWKYGHVFGLTPGIQGGN